MSRYSETEGFTEIGFTQLPEVEYTSTNYLTQAHHSVEVTFNKVSPEFWLLITGGTMHYPFGKNKPILHNGRAYPRKRRNKK